MAQLKDTVVQGTLSATDALISTSVQTSILRVPSSSNSTTYGPGTNGQILRSNGTKVYWGTLAATDIPDVYIKKAGNNDGIMTGTLTLHGLKGTADIDYGTTLPASPTTGQIFFQISDPWYELPPVNSSDNGKILTVVGGQWTAATKQNELPSVSSSDNGKVLSVVNGEWAASSGLSNLSAQRDHEVAASIINGDTCTNRIAKNEYILLRNSTISGRTDGFYKSGATIEAGTTVTAGMIAEKNIGQEMKRIYDGLGNVASLTTSVKTSAVAAINEVKAGVDTNSGAITNIDDLLYKISYGGETVTATVAVKNGTASSIDSSLRVSYTDNYIIVKGAVRLRGFTRTGANPGITVTIPSGITVGSARSAYGISSSMNPTEYMTLQMSAGVNSFTITTSETVANAVNGTWVISIPPILLRR